MLPNLWDLAVKSLDPDLRQLIDFEHTQDLDALREVTRLAEEKKEQCVRSRIRIRRKRGEVIIVRDVFEKIIKYVQKFKEIGDVAVQYDPIHASLPWAGVRLLLQFAISETQTFGFMVEGLGQVTNLITRYAIVEELYLKEQTNATYQLRASLIQLYAATLVFLGKSYHFFGQNATKRILKSVFTLSEDGIQHLLQDLTHKQAHVDQAALLVQGDRQQIMAAGVSETNMQALDISQNLDALSKMVLTDNTAIQRDVSVLLQLNSELQVPLHRIASQLSEIDDTLDASSRANILCWLSKIPYAQHHEDSRKGRHLGSGIWLLQKGEYRDWRISSFSSILWLHGIPGSGKTTLVSLIIDELSREIAAGPDSPPIAYFYCARDSAEPERSKPEEVLLSIARQLSGKDVNVPIHPATNELYFAQKTTPRRKLTLLETVDLILAITSDNPITIVLDALDECDALHRHELLEAFDVIIQQSTNIVKIFVSSREDNDIVCRLERSPNLYISADDNKKDIENFVRVEVDEAIAKKRLLSGNVLPQLRRRIVDTLERDAQGMFRWVSLQIQNLCNPQRMKVEGDVIQELGKLPKSLSDLYAVIYDQIRDSGPSSKKMAERLLQWLTVAQKPLSVNMAIAIVSRANPDGLTPFGYHDLLNITCNLIVIDRNVVRFAHLSVRDYLEHREEFNKDEVHMHVAMTCLEEYIYLEQSDQRLSGSKASLAGQLDVKLNIRNYSCFFWPTHAAQVRAEPQRLRLNDILRAGLFRFVDASPSFRDWRRDVSTGSLISRIPFKTKIENSAARTPFLAICIFGFSKLLESYKPSDFLACCQTQMPIYEGRYAGMKGHHITIYHGHRDCTKTLLDQGFDVNEATASGETCLHIAVRKERKDLLQLLVDYGADTDALTLTFPKEEEDTEMPEDIPDKGLLWEKPSSRLRSSLGFRNGAGSINSAIDEPAEAPLHYAALHGSVACVSELIRLNVNPNVRNSLGDTPLLKALEGWHDQIVQMLLHAGADVNPRSLYGRTPLHFAAASGQYETAISLVRYGADPHLQDSLGSTPIETARRYNNDRLCLSLEALAGGSQVNTAPQGPFMLEAEIEAAIGADSSNESPPVPPTDLKSPDKVLSEWNNLLGSKTRHSKWGRTRLGDFLRGTPKLRRKLATGPLGEQKG